MKKRYIYISTSGWSYKHWDNVFYPSNLKKANQLQYYNSLFNTIEINNSFYRQPKPENYANWESIVDSSFKFSVKANRYFTHLKKLKVSQHDIEDFLKGVDCLNEKLGPILFQLPPKWNINPERFESFLAMLPNNYRYVFEFRNHSWYHSSIYELLKKYNCAFCIYELDGHLSPIELTADFLYIRLHGPGAKYQGSYTKKTLRKWANVCLSEQKKGRDVFIYFDNDQNGYAAFNALEIEKMITPTLLG
jgi:uncharacterized protein YecE (DUF72 family)